MSFGTDCGPILAPLLNKIQCFFRDICLVMFLDRIFAGFGLKLFLKMLYFLVLFVIFRDLCPHTCPFYDGKTHKCAATVFTTLTKKNTQREKTNISNATRLDFGATFA